MCFCQFWALHNFVVLVFYLILSWQFCWPWLNFKVERDTVCVCVCEKYPSFVHCSVSALKLWCMFCCVLSVRLLLNKFPNKENKVVLCIVNVIQCSLENCSNVHLSYMWYNGQLPKYIRNVKTDNFHFMCYLNFKEKGCLSTKLYNALLLFSVFWPWHYWQYESVSFKQL